MIVTHSHPLEPTSKNNQPRLGVFSLGSGYIISAGYIYTLRLAAVLNVTRPAPRGQANCHVPRKILPSRLGPMQGGKSLHHPPLLGWEKEKGVGLASPLLGAVLCVCGCRSARLLNGKQEKHENEKKETQTQRAQMNTRLRVPASVARRVYIVGGTVIADTVAKVSQVTPRVASQPSTLVSPRSVRTAREPTGSSPGGGCDIRRSIAVERWGLSSGVP